jgi:hypothetical protein
MSESRVLTRGVGVLVATLASAALAGCGNSNLVRVTGQVVENGQEYRLAEGETIQIDFSTADQAYPPLSLGTFVKKDGAFVVDMNDGTGRGLPPGKYKIRLNRDGTSLRAKANPKLFKEAHTLEVGKGASVHLTIDLATGTATP